MDLGKTDLIQHHIELTDYTPIKDRYRRIPPHQYEEVRKHLREMLEVGAIRKLNSPWASPFVLVCKKHGSLRFCIDLHHLNATTGKYNDYVFKLRERLEWAYKTAQEHIERDATHRKQYYDRKFHCMEIVPGDIILARQKVFGTTRKIEDQWENPVYRVVEKLGDGPVYKIQKLGEHGESSFRELHRNMLHPLMQVVEDLGETQGMGTESAIGDSLLNEV